MRYIIVLLCIAFSVPGFAQETFQASVPVRAITQGPQGHWFSYYDKAQFSVDDRYVLGMEVDFQDRTPRPEDKIVLGMADLQDHDKWIPFGETKAWCWQQGCMLQWLPGSETQVIYNDRQGTQFVSIMPGRIHGGKALYFPRPSTR